MDHGADGQGVVDGGGVQPLHGLQVAVGQDAVVHAVRHGLANGGAQGPEGAALVSVDAGPVGGVQGNDPDGAAAVHHDLRRLRVRPDVELRRGGGVGAVAAAAHQDDLTNFAADLRLQPHGHGDVGEGTHGDQGDVPVAAH